MKTLPLLLLLSGCTRLVESPPSPPPTTTFVLQQTSCFSDSECSGVESCVDPRYPVCGNPPACDGLIQCGCRCLAACTATSCQADEVCSTSGCCMPRPCSTDFQCGVDGTRCVAGQCKRRGTCTPPVP